MRIKNSLNQIENGCLIILKEIETNTSYDTEKHFLIFKEYCDAWYYLIDADTNIVVAKYSNLNGIQEDLEQDYNIVNIIKADKLCLSWED